MMQNEQIICVTTDTVPGRNIQQVLGFVIGTARLDYEGGGTFRRQGVAPTETASAHNQAVNEMLKFAAAMKANAVVGVRFDSANGYQNSLQAAGGAGWFPARVDYTAYGTAVVLD